MMMKRYLALVCAAMMILTMAGCGKDKTPPEQVADSQPTLTVEELEEEVDFERATEDGKIATAEQGEVVVATTSNSPASTATATVGAPRSTVNPENIWDADPVNYDSDSFTLPDAVQMKDGSLGVLSIPSIKLSVPIYETDNEIEDMFHGVAHMKETSCWAGNVGLAGHNRGANTFFGQIHKLKEGDTVKLTTALGERSYKVTGSYTIGQDDWSYLGRTDDNRITLITCIDNAPTQRLCVQAVEG